MTTMTIHVEDDFAEALRAHARAVGTSVNRAVKELIRRCSGSRRPGRPKATTPT